MYRLGYFLVSQSDVVIKLKAEIFTNKFKYFYFCARCVLYSKT